MVPASGTMPASAILVNTGASIEAGSFSRVRLLESHDVLLAAFVIRTGPITFPITGPNVDKAVDKSRWLTNKE